MELLESIKYWDEHYALERKLEELDHDQATDVLFEDFLDAIDPTTAG